MIQEAIKNDDKSLLPTATKFPNLQLVISTKDQGGDSCYDMFLDGQNKACFMFNKNFLKKKFEKSLVKP